MGKHVMAVDMACNDPDNGDFVGRVCQISLSDGRPDLTAKAWTIMSYRGCPKLREEPNTLMLSGKSWPFIRRQSWHGNWCWDRYVMETSNVTEFLKWLHARDLFVCEGGWSDLYDAWNTSGPLVLPDRWWVA